MSSPVFASAVFDSAVVNDVVFDNVVLASQLLERRASSGRSAGLEFEDLVGRLVELGGRASLTAAFGLILQAQRRGEPVAWVSARDSLFYAPDAVDSGVDLDALPIVRVPDGPSAARAADKLLRSGGFGLVVVDLGARCALPAGLQGRLLHLAERHASALVALTDKPADAPSLSSLVSLRLEAAARRLEAGPAESFVGSRFALRLEALKDKRRGPGWSVEEVCRGPLGLR